MPSTISASISSAASCYAYITSAGLIIDGMTGMGSHWSSVLFTLVFSVLVWHSTRAVDRISVLLVILMGLSFVFGISGLSMNIRLDSAARSSRQ